MNKGKIIVIGANQNALVFAEFAAKADFEVVLYEAKEKDEVAYDWTDDMAPATFAQIGLPMPPKDVFSRKRNWTFVPPSKQKFLQVQMAEEELDISVQRRPLNDWLEKRALDAGATVNYGTPVRKAVIDGDKVVGVYLNKTGERIDADLVVDCGGVASTVRGNLPDGFKIPQRVNPADTFFVRRTFFERPATAERPEYTNKAYLKHNNEAGISWCILSEDEKMADVLIGRVGQMNNETFYNALKDLKKENEIIGDKVVKGGELLCIPVRHPISRMVANGYALLGDSAYMTIPMLGSGIASGMHAAKMLVEVLSEPVGEPFSIANLYRYQYRFMQEIGAKHAAVDLMKNWLLASGDGDVDFLFCSGVLGQKELILGAKGEMIKESLPEMAHKAIVGWRNIPVLLQLAGLLAKMEKQYKVAAKLPAVYDEAALCAWQNKYEKCYK